MKGDKSFTDIEIDIFKCLRILIYSTCNFIACLIKFVCVIHFISIKMKDRTISLKSNKVCKNFLPDEQFVYLSVCSSVCPSIPLSYKVFVYVWLFVSQSLLVYYQYVQVITKPCKRSAISVILSKAADSFCMHILPSLGFSNV